MAHPSLYHCETQPIRQTTRRFSVQWYFLILITQGWLLQYQFVSDCRQRQRSTKPRRIRQACTSPQPNILTLTPPALGTPTCLLSTSFSIKPCAMDLPFWFKRKDTQRAINANIHSYDDDTMFVNLICSMHSRKECSMHSRKDESISSQDISMVSNKNFDSEPEEKRYYTKF